jgi:methylated-DNA-[protein]-cysteine S-methyltransferase
MPCVILFRMKQEFRFAVMESPIGPLTLASSEKGLAAVHFGDAHPPEGLVDESIHRDAIQQLQEYFDGKRTSFDLPLDLQGTPFQQSVWNKLQTIPYGQTCSYGEIARSLGKPGAARAVGMANHDNPIAVVVPCHRVVGADGSLTGYAGGLDVKKHLLTFESQHQHQQQGSLLFT